MKKRILSVVLVVVMVISLLPVSAFADDSAANSNKLIAGGEAQHVVINGNSVKLSFTPEKDGTYIFRSENSGDSKAMLYADRGGELWEAKGNDDGVDINFEFSYTCREGTTYYLECMTCCDYDEYDVYVVYGGSDMKVSGELIAGGATQHVNLREFGDNTVRFSFTPETDGEYAFRVTTRDSAALALMKATETGLLLLERNHWDEYDNLILDYYCEAGETYYVDCGSGYDNDDFDVYVFGLGDDDVDDPDDSYDVLAVGETKHVVIDNGYVYLSFTPEESGMYVFRSGNCGDSWAELYTAYGELIGGNDDDGGNYNFRLFNYCEAGETYLLKCMSCWDYDEYDVYVKNISSDELTVGGEAKHVVINGYDDSVYLDFTPEKDGTYIFRSENCNDSKASLYAWNSSDNNFGYISENDDGGFGMNFGVPYSCKAGETYYLKCMSCWEYDEYDVYVEEFTYSFTWNYADCVLTISGSGDMNTYDSSLIPWYDDLDGILEIVIEDGITGISNYAFYNCGFVESVTIPASVRSIGSYAFDLCSNIETINYAGTIEQWNEININTDGNNKLFASNINCSDGVIDNHNKCGANAEWSYADGVLTISGSGDMWDYDADYVSWEEYKDSIRSVVVEEGITSIGELAFYGFDKIESVSLPEGLTRICFMAFNGCHKLSEITLPSTMTCIENAAFSNRGIKEVNFNGTRRQWDDVYKNYEENIPLLTVVHCTDGDADDSMWCGENVRWIFKDGELRIFGNGSMFINYVDKWNDIKQSVKSIVIEDGVNSIGYSAFAGFTNLESVTIPRSMCNIYDGAFGDCTSLKDAYYQGSEEEWGWIYVAWGPDGGNEELPDNYALQNATMHYNVEIESPNRCGPDAVWSFEDSVLTISGSGDMWDFSAQNIFRIPWYDYFIESIVVEDGITGIGANSFRERYEVKSVTLPASLNTIGWDAFRYCENLGEINFLGTMEQWRAINVEENAIANDMIIRCTDGDVDNYHNCGAEGDNATWSYENGVLTISGTGAMADYDYEEHAPWYNWSIRSVVIEDGITSIGDYAFLDCYEIGSVSIPASVTKIGKSTIPYLYQNINCNISFSGTKAQWMAIDHEGYDNTFNTNIIQCSDGNIDLSQYCGAEGSWGENAAWGFKDGVLTISGSGAVSEELGGWGVPWNEYLDEITDIVIEDGITYIGCIFYASFNFKTLTVPENITIGQLFPAGGGEPPLRDIYYGGTAEQWEACKARSWGGYEHFYIIHFSDGSVYDGFHTCGDGMTWSVENGVLTISGEGEIDYHNWSVGDEKFTSVVIPEGVTAICDEAFSNCKDLKSVYIPDSVTSIGYGVFSGCTSLESISIPAGITTINSSTFFNCQSLKRITLKSGITTIGEGPYFDIYTSSSDMSIYSPAFYGCINLSEVEYEGTVSDWNAIDIAANPEGDLELLRAKVIASDGEITADTSSCGHDASWSYDDGVLTISGTGSVSDFYYSTAPWAKYKDEITTVTIENGITSLGAYAFSVNGYYLCYDYPNLKTVNIPASLTSFGSCAFGSLYDTHYNETANREDVKYMFTGTMNYDGTIDQWFEINNAPWGCTVNCSDGVYDNFFWCGEGENSYDITSAAKWSIDGDVLTVSGTGALVSNINYPQTRYWRARDVHSVVVEEGIEAIGSELFRDLAINRVELPASLRRIDTAAFAVCPELNDIYYSGTMAQWNDIIVLDSTVGDFTIHCSDGDIAPSELSWTFKDGVLTISGNRAVYYSAWAEEVRQEDITSIVINEGITTICADTFGYLPNLTEVSLPDSLRVIGRGAFLDCNKLQNINIPEGVIDIEPGAFSDCSAIEKLESLGGISTIEEYTFMGCNKLKSVDIPATVTEIQYNAFHDCNSLETIDIPDGVKKIERATFESCTSLKSIDLPSSVEAIDNCAFQDCSSLTELEIPGSVASIGGSAFCSCSGLKNVSIFEGVKSIGYFAFRECTSLESITLPASLEYLDEFLFGGCSNLKDIYFCGSEEQWNELCSNGAMADSPEGVTVHFNCTPPADPASFSVSNVKALAGEEVTVSVNLENNPGIMAMVLNVDYDKTKLELLGVEDSGLTGWDFTTKAVWSDTEDSFYNGEILRLKFKVLENTGIGSVKVSVSADRGNIANYNEKTVSAKFTGGSITVYKPGDMNGDGKVNAIDLVRLVKFMSGENVELIASADVTGDGAVNSQDLVRLKKYTAGAPVVLH